MNTLVSATRTTVPSSAKEYIPADGVSPWMSMRTTMPS
jgi:hypothetical protein